MRPHSQRSYQHPSRSRHRRRHAGGSILTLVYWCVSCLCLVVSMTMFWTAFITVALPISPLPISSLPPTDEVRTTLMEPLGHTTKERNNAQDQRGSHGYPAFDWSQIELPGADDKQAAMASSRLDNNSTRALVLGNHTFVWKLLRDAGVIDNDLVSSSLPPPHILRALPTDDELSMWIGIGISNGQTTPTKPRIVGLETCTTFRSNHPLKNRVIAPAGMFNTGTNLLATYLGDNCDMTANDDDGEATAASASVRLLTGSSSRRTLLRDTAGSQIAWQVPWGKHVIASLRTLHQVESGSNSNSLNTLPVVMIRDPYHWMMSLCEHPYAAKWHHRPPHCPNLVPTSFDYGMYQFREPHIPVRIKWQQILGKKGDKDGMNSQVQQLRTQVWDSIAHLWNDWYSQYYIGATYPRLMVRLEDLFFRPRDVIETVCTCAGGRAASTSAASISNFRYKLGSAKNGPGHGDRKTNWIQAMVQYTHRQREWQRELGNQADYGVTPRKVHSWNNMTLDDLRYARQELDEQLMKAFGYMHPPIS